MHVLVISKIELINIADISSECYFINDSGKIENNNKLSRFLLYWWFATNVYLISGKANRIELPNCLITKIRAIYPEENNAYVGYKKK